MKILVTGGAGFIGCNFIRYILNKYPDYNIVNLDLLTYAGNLCSLADIDINDKYKFVKGDICDVDLVNNLFENEKFDIVINFAAESHVDISINNPSVFTKTNIIGTQVLLEASKLFNIKRYHQISTDEVYGDLPLDKPQLLFKEDMKLKPSSPYSATKASADLLVNSYFRTFKLPTTISRCSNNYGPYQYPEKLIPHMILKAINEEKLPIYGDGLNIRDWIHVSDHCRAIDKIIHKGIEGEIYNVGSYNEKSNIDVVKTIIKKLNKSEKLIEYVDDRPGHDLRYAIDSSKLEKIGWRPTINFEDGICETIEWYVKNNKWIDKLQYNK